MSSTESSTSVGGLVRGLQIAAVLTVLNLAFQFVTAGQPAALAGLAGAVFVLTFAQAAVGGRSTLWIHIPGAMVVTTGAVWVAVWALTRANRT